MKARATAALAWQLTDAALAEGGPGLVAALQVAAETFGRVDSAHLSAQERQWLAGNHGVCASSLAEGREERVRLWRERVDATASRRDRATAQHNLALVLLSGRPTAEEVREAISLCEQSAPARADDPRYAYQTAMLAGTALTRLLDGGLAPWSPAELWARARGWLQQAAVSARALGTGSELAHAGIAMSTVARSAPTLEAFTETSEAAWDAVGAAVPYLIFDRELNEQEAEAAAEVAVALAQRLAARTIAIASANVAFVLREEVAGSVLRWLRRASAPLRRPLRARLGAPAGVSIAQWQEWLAVVARREPLALVGALRRVREVAPQFLAEGDERLAATWRWLEARPGALAVNVHLARPVSIAALLNLDPLGQRRVYVLGLEVAPPPQDPGPFADRMRAAACADGTAPESHAAMVAWARAGIIEPILGFHGERPSEVLWAPGRGLRGIAPSALWDVPVSCATTLDLPESALRSRPRSTLVTLADPGPSTCGAAELGGAGRAALEEVATVAKRAGRVRRLASCGSRFGAALLGAAQDLRNRPSSAADILGEAREHDIIVMIAHGEAPTPEDAAVLCVSESGGVDRLDVAALGRSPEAFCGANVVLLSCETGRVGDALAEPGGVAGALLAAGARAVIAPLWPVRLDVAVEVAREVLEGMREGWEPAVALARL
ncbi:MAG: CHAT domain-containing protein, partial [Planctomycetota bacterium]|nr:CHAT domain-containing protein [Planctomycetota bacterium]